MADPMTDERVTEIVRAATFGKAIRLADIVRASDLDLQRKEEFRKAIGLVWMRGVRELAREVRRLRAELAKRCDLDGCEEFREWLSGEKADADKRARQAEAEVEQLRAEVRERAEDEAYALNRLHDTREALIRELRASSRFRKAWKSARRGRKRYRAELDDLARQVERLRPELADAQRAAAVLQSAADEANRRITLARRTAAELHEFNSPGGEHLDGCPGCRLEAELGEARPDPYLLALEEVAQRYPEAFAWHLANEQAKATRKDHT